MAIRTRRLGGNHRPVSGQMLKGAIDDRSQFRCVFHFASFREDLARLGLGLLARLHLDQPRASGGLVAPPSPNLKSEVSIVCSMACATLPSSDIEWDARFASYGTLRTALPVSPSRRASPAP